MDRATRTWLASILLGYNGDVERAAAYMARTYRSIAGLAQFRAWFVEIATT